MAGYLDAQTRHDANWQIGKIKRGHRLSVLGDGLLCLGALPARLPDPALVYFRPDCHLYLSSFDRLAQPAARALFRRALTLLCCSYGYDLLSVIYPDRHLFSLPPQYRLWTWLLFYLTGQLFNDPKVAEWIRNPQVIKGSIIALPFVYLFTWFYERHFFFALFKADRNAFILTGSQIYILIVLLVIAANAVQFKKNREWKEAVLATVSKAMTGVYILHYSVFHLLVMLIPVHSLATKLGVIALTFVLSVLISLAALSSTLLRKVITL